MDTQEQPCGTACPNDEVFIVIGGPRHGKKTGNHGQNWIVDEVHIYAQEALRCVIGGQRVRIPCYVYFGWKTDDA